MRVVIAGSSGLIGTALRRDYGRDGHRVVRLVRREARAPDERRWDPARPDPRLVDGADVVINLAGAAIGGRRWTRRYREIMLRSRTETARALALMAAGASDPPPVLLSASGIRYYGIDRGDEILTESSPPVGEGVLAPMTRAWEAATRPATAAGVAVCHLRFGLVLSRHGGLLAALLPAFRAGLGTSFGTGREYWSHISLVDAVRAIRFLASHGGVGGPYNITASEPVRCRDLARALGRAVHRPVLLRVPTWALRVPFGGIAGEVLGGLRVLPARLTEAGFRLRHPDIDSVLHSALAADSSS